MTRPSERMSQPHSMRDQIHRRECVAVDGNDAWALFCACADGDLARVNELLAKDASLIHAQLTYAKPIDMALREGHLDIVRSIHAADHERRLAFFMNGHYTRVDDDELERRGHQEILRYLREEYRPSLVPRYRESLDSIDGLYEGDSDEIVLAALRGQPELGTATNSRGRTLVALALEAKRSDLARALHAEGASLDGRTADGASLVDIAASTCPDAIPWLLETGARPSVHALVVADRRDAVRALLLKSPELVHRVNHEGDGPLAYAVEHGLEDMVELLLEFGADPNLPEENAPFGSALARACLRHDLPFMRRLLEAGAVPDAVIDSSGDTFAFCKHRMGHEKNSMEAAQRLLLEYGGLPGDESDLEFEWKPLDAARMRSVREARSSLRGEDLDRLIGDFAVHASDDDVSELIAKGIDVNHRDWLGRTRLHAEASYGRAAHVELLLDAGADIDAIDVHSSTTPLGYAARCGQVEAVELLLARGARRDLPTDRAWARPLACAEFQLAHFERKHGQRSTHWLITGYRTDRSREDLQTVIDLLG